MVGQFGGLGALSRELTRQLRARGAHVAQADEPDAHLQAMTANLYRADLYLGLESQADPTCTISYFSVPAFASIGGNGGATGPGGTRARTRRGAGCFRRTHARIRRPAEPGVFARALLRGGAQGGERGNDDQGVSPAHRLLLSNQALVNRLASRFERSTDLISTSVEFDFSTSS